VTHVLRHFPCRVTSMHEVRPPCADACSCILQHHFVPALCPRDPAALHTWNAQQDKERPRRQQCSDQRELTYRPRLLSKRLNLAIFTPNAQQPQIPTWMPAELEKNLAELDHFCVRGHACKRDRQGLSQLRQHTLRIEGLQRP